MGPPGSSSTGQGAEVDTGLSQSLLERREQRQRGWGEPPLRHNDTEAASRACVPGLTSLSEEGPSTMCGAAPALAVSSHFPAPCPCAPGDTGRRILSLGWAQRGTLGRCGMLSGLLSVSCCCGAAAAASLLAKRCSASRRSATCPTTTCSPRVPMQEDAPHHQRSPRRSTSFRPGWVFSPWAPCSAGGTYRGHPLKPEPSKTGLSHRGR